MTVSLPSKLSVHAGELSVDKIGAAIGVQETDSKRGWFTSLVTRYFKRNLERRARAPMTLDDRTATERALSTIRWACLKSSVTGALCGSVSTVASVLTAESQGTLAWVAIPATGAAIGTEMMFRTVAHVDLVCELADIFGVRFNPDDEDDIFRLYALAFGHHDDGGDEDDPGKGLVENILHLETEQAGEKIGHFVLGESVMRNIVPFFGIAASAITNLVVTRKLGHTVRRYMRYERAMRDALGRAEGMCKGQLDLLIEGIWFIFTADGRLAPEEVGMLARLLGELDPIRRKSVVANFTEDEIDWMERIKNVPEEMRDHFLFALEVAATVDKEVNLPERKILKRVARIFHRPFEVETIEKMIAEFEEAGVLTQKAPHHRAH